jgi:hypothetical protein
VIPIKKKKRTHVKGHLRKVPGRRKKCRVDGHYREL